MLPVGIVLLTSDRFPETKGRTLEEIGALFGDENIATRWYDLSKEDKERLAQEAIADIPETDFARGERLKREAAVTGKAT